MAMKRARSIDVPYSSLVFRNLRLIDKIDNWNGIVKFYISSNFPLGLRLGVYRDRRGYYIFFLFTDKNRVIGCYCRNAFIPVDEGYSTENMIDNIESSIIIS